MEHHYSILFGPVNDLLLKLGHPPDWWVEAMGGDPAHEVFWLPDHVIMAMCVVGLLALVLVPVKRRLSVEKPGRLQHLLELLVGGMNDMIESEIGHGQAKRFLPFILTLALFIFTCNIFGLFFFIQPPTANTSTTFALSIMAFIVYNYVGIKDNGLIKYLKHFMGPMPALAIIMVPIEIISHLARILSLAVRLFGNIFGEHTATGIFVALVPFVVPWPMMGLGIFGSLLQSFIFIMLTMAYIQGAIGHEEH
jgi:F-type H+-transporting ATPase subunit a